MSEQHKSSLRHLWRNRWSIGLIMLAAITQAWGILLALGGVFLLERYRNWEDDWTEWEDEHGW